MLPSSFQYRLICGVATAAVMSSCAGLDRTAARSPDRPATPVEIAKWREQQQISVASDDEIAAANRCRREFNRDKANSPDQKLKVVFHPGKRVGELDRLSTTSTYTLYDAKGKFLAEAPSCVAGPVGDESVIDAEQAAWFAPDGKRVVVYEYAKYGLGPPPLTIVFSEDPENPGSWKTKFLELPLFTGGIIGEGDRATCRGILGDELLFDAATHDDKVSKKRISEFKETHPFPFTIG